MSLPLVQLTVFTVHTFIYLNAFIIYMYICMCINLFIHLYNGHVMSHHDTSGQDRTGHVTPGHDRLGFMGIISLGQMSARVKFLVYGK